MNAAVRKLEKILKDALRRSTDHQLVIGPTVWIPSDADASGKLWYFMFVTGDKAKQFRVVQISAPDKDTADTTRTSLKLIAVQHRPLVVHDFADELDMARWCEAIWPGPRSTKIRKSIEAERATTA